MSINQESYVQALGLKMLSGNVRLLGLPKERIQVVMTLPNIAEFNTELYEAIDFFKQRAESFIITKSSYEACQEVINKFGLRENLISREFGDFSNSFLEGEIEKSLFIIDMNCQIRHKEIL